MDIPDFEPRRQRATEPGVASEISSPNKRLTKVERSNLVQAYERGALLYQLATEFGIDVHTVKRQLKQAGEAKILEYYELFEVPAELRSTIQEALVMEFRTGQIAVLRQRAELDLQLGRLKHQQAKLLQAHYAGAVPLDLMKTEQDRLGSQIASIQERLDAITTDRDVAEHKLTQASELLANCGQTYATAPDHVRRMLNQALFEAFYVEDDSVRAEFAEPFKSLLGPAMVRAEVESEVPGERRTEGLALTKAIETLLARPKVARTNKPALYFFGAGLKETDLVQQVLKSYHEIRDEIVRWRQILEVPYQEYLQAQAY